MVHLARLQLCAIGLMLAIGSAPAGATPAGVASITVVIDENGNVAFSDGTPLTGYSPTAGAVVLCDGAANADGTACAAGIVNSDILVFGGSSTNISYQSDKSDTAGPGELAEPPYPAADLTSFTLQVPDNAVFLQEAAANASGIERTSWNPASGQAGYFTVGGVPAQYQIISDGPVVTPEPATFWTAVLPFLGLLLLAHRRQRSKQAPGPSNWTSIDVANVWGDKAS